MASVAAERNLMTFDEAWPILQEEAINKLIDNLEIEGLPNKRYFTSEEYIRFYTVVYDVACAKTVGTAQKLYGQYSKTFEDYISSKVLPSLRGKENENLLRELLRQWNNHKTMTRWLSRFFDYLSRYYIPKNGLPSLVQTSYWTFYNRVYGEINDQLSDAIISLIGRERDGEQIDLAMVKQVLDIFEEIAEDALKNYEEHIEKALVDYSKHGSTKPYEDSMREGCHNDKPTLIIHRRKWRSRARNSRMLKDDILKVEKCFEKEQTSVSQYLRLRIKDRVLEVYGEIKDRVCDAISSLETNIQIDKGRGGEWIGQDILKQVRHIFEEIGDDASKIYAKDIEEALVAATALSYSNKALDWIATKSYEDYMLQVEKCLEKEESRLSEYLRPINKNKVLEVVRHELLDVHADKLEETKASSRLGRSKL